MTHRFLLVLLLLAAPAHAEWTYQNSGTTADLVDVCFVDEQHGWAIGNDSWTPVIIATDDGGVTWRQQECPAEMAVLNKVTFLNDRVGFIASESFMQGGDFESYIFSTADGGETWEIGYSAPYYYQFKDIFFIDDDKGWAAGGVVGQTGEDQPHGGVVLITTDGGVNWNEQLYIPPISDGYVRHDTYNSIVFSDANTGWMLGNDHGAFTPPPTNVYHTTDGGESWNIINQIPEVTRSLYITAPDTLWTSHVQTLVSNDGGLSWEDLGFWSYDFSALDGTSGWSVGDALGGLGILYTDDGGTNWEVQLSRNSDYVIAIDNVGENFACGVGQSGVIVTYGPIPMIAENNAEPATFTHDQNYPNPFNASTTISYTLTTDSPVSVKLYSATGQLVRTLLNRHMSAGRHSLVVDGSGLASGIYIARLQAQGATKYTRMLLLK